MTSEQYCVACGQHIPAGDQFCTGCGTPLLPPVSRKPIFADEVAGTEQTTTPPPVSSPVSSPAPRPRRRGWPWLIAAIMLFVLAGVLGFHLGGGSEEPTADSDSTADPTPVASDSAGTDSGASASEDGSEGGTGPGKARPAVAPQDELRQIAEQNRSDVESLVGSWSPQLAAVSPAAGDASWADALTRYRQLQREYPDVLLVDTGQWPHSYRYGGMYAVLVPEPTPAAASALQWCRDHGRAIPSDCAAKLLDTSGSWEGNFETG